MLDPQGAVEGLVEAQPGLLPDARPGGVDDVAVDGQLGAVARGVDDVLHALDAELPQLTHHPLGVVLLVLHPAEVGDVGAEAAGAGDAGLLQQLGATVPGGVVLRGVPGGPAGVAGVDVDPGASLGELAHRRAQRLDPVVRVATGALVVERQRVRLEHQHRLAAADALGHLSHPLLVGVDAGQATGGVLPAVAVGDRVDDEHRGLAGALGETHVGGDDARDLVGRVVLRAEPQGLRALGDLRVRRALLVRGHARVDVQPARLAGVLGLAGGARRGHRVGPHVSSEVRPVGGAGGCPDHRGRPRHQGEGGQREERATQRQVEGHDTRVRDATASCPGNAEGFTRRWGRRAGRGTGRTGARPGRA